MTDPRPTPRAAACPDCAALVPDTIDDRRRHRSDHAHDRKVVEALRERLKEIGGQLRETQQKFADLRRDFDGIKIPEPVDPLEINREDWPELDDPDDDVLEDDQRSSYADDDLYDDEPAPRPRPTDDDVEERPYAALYTPGRPTTTDDDA